jgi:hypothetical protein
MGPGVCRNASQSVVACSLYLYQCSVFGLKLRDVFFLEKTPASQKLRLIYNFHVYFLVLVLAFIYIYTYDSQSNEDSRKCGAGVEAGGRCGVLCTAICYAACHTHNFSIVSRRWAWPPHRIPSGQQLPDLALREIKLFVTSVVVKGLLNWKEGAETEVRFVGCLAFHLGGCPSGLTCSHDNRPQAVPHMGSHEVRKAGGSYRRCVASVPHELPVALNIANSVWRGVRSAQCAAHFVLLRCLR